MGSVSLVPILQRLTHGLKAATARVTRLLFSRDGGRWGPSSRFSLSRTDLGPVSPESNSIVMAVAGWIARTFPEAPPRVQTREADDSLQVAKDPGSRRLLTLLRRPNPFYSGVLLWMATVISWLVTGNAYWLKLRSDGRLVVQLWWVPSHLMRPVGSEDGRVFIESYEYRPDSRYEPDYYAPSEIVHFRYGLDPENPRQGLSPLAAVLREIFTDEEAARFTGAILKNLGIPGLIISPKNETDISPEEAPGVKQDIIDKFGGMHRGEPMVMIAPTDVEVLGYSPQQMDLRQLRRIPEERITAIFGLPAIVAGLGAGLDRSTFSNFAEAREAAYESNIIPTQHLFAEELRVQLLPDFADLERHEFDFDNSGVRVLQEDENAKAERLTREWLAGGLTLNQYVTGLGQPAVEGPEGELRAIPINVTLTPPERLLADVREPVAGSSSSADGGAAAGDGEPTPPETRGLSPAEAKAARDTVPAIRRLRERLQTPLQAELDGFLTGQRNRVLRALRNATKDVSAPEVFDFGDEQARLAELLQPYYLRSLNGTAEVVRSALGVDFTLDDPLTRAYLREAGAQIVGITETTRSAIAFALQEGQAAGEGYTGLAARIRDMTEWSPNRARTVARTELGSATNISTIHAFRASGVVTGVQIFDGTDHPPCSDLNGRRVTLQEAAALPPLSHPNCTRAYGPITAATPPEERARTNGHAKELVHA